MIAGLTLTAVAAELVGWGIACTRRIANDPVPANAHALPAERA